jgi:hypothetical protein
MNEYNEQIRRSKKWAKNYSLRVLCLEKVVAMKMGFWDWAVETSDSPLRILRKYNNVFLFKGRFLNSTCKKSQT